MEDTAKDQYIVRTVIHADGSYAFFCDETEAANYAVQQHASLGRLMTRAAAHEMVVQTAPKSLDLMLRNGSVAWADVPDATAWVDELRGNDAA